VQNELIFKASLKKALLLLAISVCFVVLGIWLTTERPILGWLCVGFFGLGIPASLLMMRPIATYLRLDEQGFEIVAMSRRTAFKWSDVEGFYVGSIRGAKMIGIAFSPEYTKQRAGRAIASALSGMEGAIADSYNAPIEEVCRTLNEWKARFGIKTT
jgi:hypothetical protein